MRLVTSVLAAAVLASGIAVLMAHESANAQTAPSPAASSSPAVSASTSAAPAVNTKDFLFAPATLTVAVGTKVTFKNSDPVAHTVTAADKSFDSGNLDQNATWSHVFDKAGTYNYVCTYHPYMKGTIVVK